MIIKRPCGASVHGSALSGALSTTRQQPRLARGMQARLAPGGRTLQSAREHGLGQRCAATAGAAHAPQDGGGEDRSYATPSNVAWRDRAGAMGGGTAASFRCRRIRVLTASWVREAMLRSASWPVAAQIDKIVTLISSTVSPGNLALS